MDANYKGQLQEYCQRRCLPLPKYHLLKQSGPPHSQTFQVEVEVDGQYFTGYDLCLTQKQAQQSAAHIADDALNPTQWNPSLTQLYSRQSAVHSSSKYVMPLRSYSSLSKNISMKHMPIQYDDSEQFVTDIISSDGGRIRKIWAPDEQGRYQFEITSTYYYCENICQHHKKNHIYFIVDPVQKTYYQKCHDPKCFGFQSVIKSLSTNEEHTPPKRKPIPSRSDSIFIKRLKHET